MGGFFIGLLTGIACCVGIALVWLALALIGELSRLKFDLIMAGGIVLLLISSKMVFRSVVALMLVSNRDRNKTGG